MNVRFFAFALGVFALACACSPNLHPSGALPLTNALQAQRIAAGTPPIHRESVSAHLLLSQRATALPMPKGFAATLALGASSVVPAGTVAYVITSLRNRAPIALPATLSPIIYLSIEAGKNVRLGRRVSLRFAIPARYIKAGMKYALAAYDPSNPSAGWQLGYTRAALVSGATLKMTAAMPFFLAASLTYDLALYASRTIPSPSTQTYALSGRMQQVYTYAYPMPTSSPSAIASQPPVTVDAQVQQFYTIGTASPPPPISGGSTASVHVTEVDTTQGGSTASATESYLAPSSTGIGLLGSVDYSFASFSQTPNQTTTAYSSPQLLEPLKSTSTTWTNSPAATIDQSFAGGQSYARTIAPNGTYTELGSITTATGTLSVSIAENSDGSGSYVGPFHDGACEYAFSGPTSTGSSSTTIVVNKYAYPTALPSATPTPAGNTPPPCLSLTPSPSTIPTWYPSPPASFTPASPGPVFYAETDSSAPSTLIPASCGKAKGVRSRLVARSIWQLDTIVGYSEKSTLDTYIASSNTIACMVLADRIDDYYDWNGDDTPNPFFTLTSKPIATVTTNETLTLSGSKASAGMPIGAIEAAQSRFFARIERVRRRLLRRSLRVEKLP